MFNSRIGRGGGRGTRRLAINKEAKSVMQGRSYTPVDHSTSSVPTNKVTRTSSSFKESETREEYTKMPSYRSNLPSGSFTMEPYVPQIQRHQTSSSHYQQFGRGQRVHQPSFQHSRSTAPRQSVPFNSPHYPQSTTNPPPLQFNNYRQDLNNLRSRLNNRSEPQQKSSSSGSASKLPQQPSTNNSSVASNRNPGSSPRRCNKRPVTSPSDSGNDDKQTPPKRSGFFGPQNKKNKKKNKSDTNSNDSKDRQNKQADLVNPELYKLQISDNKSFDEQAEELIAQLEQTDAEKKLRLEVLKDVEDIFSPYLPQLQPQIYGSSFTNIAFKTSDLDIFLYCPQGQPEYNFVSEKGRLMYRSPKFTNIVRVPRARVPVIKATHIRTNIDVDITTMSRQAVYNSRLIKYLLEADKRLRPLAMLISLWAKLNAITGHSRFTSYSIILMLIYFLQKLEPPILPPLKDILYTDNDNDWPILFRIDKQLTNTNQMCLAELFKSFFEFYQNFDFEKVILSPYLADQIPASNFIKTQSQLSDDFKLYKNKLESNEIRAFHVTYTMHIQDPIEHNINTTKNVFTRLRKLFHRSCVRLLDICKNSIKDDSKWLPLIIKQTPLKLIDEKKITLQINYPIDDENWFNSCVKDFKELLKLLLVNVSDENETDSSDNSTVAKTTNDTKLCEKFHAESSYNVFNKKFRYPLRMYMTGLDSLNELKNKFEMVTNRSTSQIVYFKSYFILEQQDVKNGVVKVTIIDKNMTGLNSFLTFVSEFKSHCGKFLTDIVNIRKSAVVSTEENVDLTTKTTAATTTTAPDKNSVLVYDLDIVSEEKLNVDGDKNKLLTNPNETEISKLNKDDKEKREESH